MELKIEKVKLSSSKVKAIYFDAFPKEERMPYWMMVAMSKLWNTEFLIFYDNNSLCGFIYMASNRNLVFVMFFAVDVLLRSKGYGSQILELVKQRNPDKKIIISIEPCDNDAKDFEIRKRRKQFYMQNGFRETKYFVKLAGVQQEIIIYGGQFSKRQFQIFFALYSNGTMWPKIWRDNLYYIR